MVWAVFGSSMYAYCTRASVDAPAPVLLWAFPVYRVMFFHLWSMTRAERRMRRKGRVRVRGEHAWLSLGGSRYQWLRNPKSRAAKLAPCAREKGSLPLAGTSGPVRLGRIHRPRSLTQYGEITILLV